MTLFLVAFFVPIAIVLYMGASHWRRGISARNSAFLLARVTPQDNSAYADLQAVGIDSSRLAHNKSLRSLLHDVPFVHELAQLLDKSGKAFTVAQLIMVMVSCGAAVAIVVGSTGGRAPAAICMGAMAVGVPLGYVYYLGTKRAVAFENQLPQTIELISLYLRSGRSLPQAFLAAAEEIAVPAHEEFAACAETYRLGRPLDTGLKTLALKYPELVGLRLFAVAVSVLGQTGGNLVEVLERIKKNLDAALMFNFKLRATTAEARMSGYFLGAAPGCFMLIVGLFNPTFLNNFFATSLGLVLFAAFVVLWLTGGLWIITLLRAKA